MRTESPTGYHIPQNRELRLEMRDPQSYDVIWQKSLTLSDIGVAHWDYPIPADAHLGSYYVTMQIGERYVEGTSFSVEDYKKPEYQVKVTAQTPRVIQGQPIKATIDARYYFGEPVVNAKVTWVVHTSTYWPMGRFEDDEDQGEAGAADEDSDHSGDDNSGEDAYGAGEQESEKTGTLDANGKLQIEIPTRVDAKRQDLTYRIEARVTDAGNREISGRGFAIATYASFYLTATPDSYVYSKGGTATINVTAQDYDKKPVATAFQVTMTRWTGSAAARPAIPSLRRKARPTPAAKARSSSPFRIPASSACW